jgi:hypothetical protein
MNDIGDILAYEPRWQCIVMLLAVLSDVRGGLAKAEAIERIASRKWFALEPEDTLPYRSNRFTSQEPRWITLIAWSRKDCVEHGLLIKGGFNNWDTTPQGFNTFAGISKACRDALLDVKRCYLWAPGFKVRMNPAYIPGGREATRPIALYEDWLRRLLQ